MILMTPSLRKLTSASTTTLASISKPAQTLASMSTPMQHNTKCADYLRQSMVSRDPKLKLATLDATRMLHIIKTEGAKQMPRITIKALKEEARKLGMVARLRDGEYRVTFDRPNDRQWAEDRAYYTDDAQDAFDTMHAMKRDFYQSREEADEDHATCTYPAWMDDAP